MQNRYNGSSNEMNRWFDFSQLFFCKFTHRVLG